MESRPPRPTTARPKPLAAAMRRASWITSRLRKRVATHHQRGPGATLHRLEHRLQVGLRIARLLEHPHLLAQARGAGPLARERRDGKVRTAALIGGGLGSFSACFGGN